ncbi:hypothetical protein AXX12_02765 [Anaerosporomusa subterranea]|uniref:DUF7305 domain-containing protein n=1 Tax=Anaerosporomusa subterranea TaxID=1794912 RepID=A0A154BT71_ANASB|nr:hypothetical protein [Anaerosporomusa subterranea]KYZ77075.1 hypothetical protein AXX12_02765 [Anaerosporomusa subterranea]
MRFFKINKQAGSAGILALVILALLGVVGAGMVRRTSTEVDMSANYRNGVAAQYLAESGAREAIAKLTQDAAFVAATRDKTANWTSPVIGSDATSGTYRVTVVGSGNNWTISSTGTVGLANRMVYFTISLASSIYSSAVFCGPDFIAEQNTHITGSIGTNGNATFGQNSVVSGVVSAHGTVTTQQNSSVPKTEGVPLVDIPIFTIPWDNNSSTLPAPSWPLSGGNYFVNGSLVLGQNTTYSGNGASTIFVKDSIVIGQNVTLSGNIKLIALKDITIEQNMDISGGVALLAGRDIKVGQNFGKQSDSTIPVLLAAQGTIDVEQNFGKGSENFKASLYANGAISLGQGTKIKGFVVSGSGVNMRQNVSITYDASFADHTELPADVGNTVNIGPWSSYKSNK